jgi:hypothetical protein
MSSWPFKQPRNVAVFTTHDVVEGGQWIQTVFHNDDDGAWQFFSESGPQGGEPKVVSLESIYKLDPSVGELANLPEGWLAWREAPGEPWQREEDDDEDGDDEDA